jgi:hypothetical protein
MLSVIGALALHPNWMTGRDRTVNRLSAGSGWLPRLGCPWVRGVTQKIPSQTSEIGLPEIGVFVGDVGPSPRSPIWCSPSPSPGQDREPRLAESGSRAEAGRVGIASRGRPSRDREPRLAESGSRASHGPGQRARARAQVRTANRAQPGGSGSRAEPSRRPRRATQHTQTETPISDNPKSDYPRCGNPKSEEGGAEGVTPRRGRLGGGPGTSRRPRRTSSGSLAWRSHGPRRGTAGTRTRSRRPASPRRSARIPLA